MKPKPLQIGDLTIAPPTLLAPMAGYTKAPFRAICHRYHCGMAFTEVVSSKDIARGLNQGTRFLEVFPEERPVGAHIYGSEVDILTRAVAVIDSLDRFALIDINCGCPVPKVKKRGSGAALMQDPEHIHTIVRAVCATTSLPVTVKTRLGLSKEAGNVSEVAQAAVASAVAGAAARGESDGHPVVRIVASPPPARVTTAGGVDGPVVGELG